MEILYSFHERVDVVLDALQIVLAQGEVAHGLQRGVDGVDGVAIDVVGNGRLGSVPGKLVLERAGGVQNGDDSLVAGIAIVEVRDVVMCRLEVNLKCAVLLSVEN